MSFHPFLLFLSFTASALIIFAILTQEHSSFKNKLYTVLGSILLILIPLIEQIDFIKDNFFMFLLSFLLGSNASLLILMLVKHRSTRSTEG
jgi:hypothetical protein